MYSIVKNTIKQEDYLDLSLNKDFWSYYFTGTLKNIFQPLLRAKNNYLDVSRVFNFSKQYITHII